MAAMQANLTTVQEFLGDAMSSGSLLDNASALDVLEELRQHDEARELEDEHTHRLETVSEGRVSLLELRSKTRLRDPDAHELIKTMDNALGQLALEQNASITSLRQHFMNDFEAGAEHRVKLLQHQAELNSTLAARTDLKAKLTAAVEHLGKTKLHLRQRITSVRGFSKLLGDKPILEERAVSMLQTGSTRQSSQAQLPDIRTVLSRPKHAFNNVNHDVSDLAEQLHAVNEESIEEAEAQKAEFDKQLIDLQHNISFQIEENLKVAKDIAQLDEGIKSLRSQTSEISIENTKYRRDLETMQANMSLAKEYLEKSIKKTDEPLAQTADLAVLDELDREDEAHMARKAHKKSLSEISPQLSLLQVSKPLTTRRTHARGLLKNLSNSLDHLLEEHEASLDSLKADFVLEFDQNTKHHDELVEEFSRQNKTRAEKTTLGSRLEVAVAHLTKTNKKLKKRRESFITFARNLALRPNPSEDVSRAINIVNQTQKVQIKDEVDAGKAIGKKIAKGSLAWWKKMINIAR